MRQDQHNEKQRFLDECHAPDFMDSYCSLFQGQLLFLQPSTYDGVVLQQRNRRNSADVIVHACFFIFLELYS
jgi:hypothetical protein